MLLNDDPSRLRHILQAGEEILQYTISLDIKALSENRLVEVLLQHNLQIVGEAASRLSGGLRAAHPEIKWPNIIGMRHRIVHDYMNVDREVVWRTVQEFLPSFLEQIRRILAEIEASN